jgi:hypothetical protein
MPRRSVTRFFIPLIDVLTLLFAMFLLMPIFGEAAQDERDRQPVSTQEPRREMDVKGLKQLLQQARRNEERLRKEQDPPTAQDWKKMREVEAENKRLKARLEAPIEKRFAIFVLSIDPGNGDLYYYDLDPLKANQKIVLKKEADARSLIDKQRARAGDRELYFLFQEPQGKSPFPIGSQRKMYEAWFKGVKHGFESPGGRG